MANKRTRDHVYARHEGACFFCGRDTWRPPWQPGCEPRRNATMDHIRLKCEDGPMNRNNAVLACEDCNNERNDQGAVEFFMLKTAGQDLAVIFQRILTVQENEQRMRTAAHRG